MENSASRSKPIQMIFFGSTQDSVILLNHIDRLSKTTKGNAFTIACIVTQPPRPIGRHSTITPTPVDIWAQSHHIPLVTFASSKEKPWLYENEHTVIDTLAPFQADIIISASYGQKIPSETIHSARFGGLNVHPSLLPRWRGADPVPWAILSGEHQTGVSIVTLSDSFDTGYIIAQKKLPITPKDTSDPLRTTLFELGASLLDDVLIRIAATQEKPTGTTQSKETTPYARKFSRKDGYIPWTLLRRALHTTSSLHENLEFLRSLDAPIIFDMVKHLSDETLSSTSLGECIERLFRALTPWPGLWTTVRLHTSPQSASEANTYTEKRLKICSCRLHATETGTSLLLEQVQLEGKTPMPFAQLAPRILEAEIPPRN